MKRASWAISVCLFFLATAGAGGQEGRLQRVREDVRAPTPADAGSTNENDSFLGSFLSGLFATQDADGNSLGGLAFGYTLLAPFYLPAAILGDEYKHHLPFAPHPYANDYRGYQILSPEMATMFYDYDTQDVPRKSWAVRASLENGNDFAGLNRSNGQLKLEHESRFGIVTNWNWFHERLPCGCTDDTVLSDTNLTFRFAQNEVASVYAGVGVRMLSDRRQTDFGFNVTYGGDWFPIRPLVVSGVLDAGSLGSAGVIHARGSVGAIYHGFEVFAGYDFLRIGGTNLQGPMAGVRFWF